MGKRVVRHRSKLLRAVMAASVISNQDTLKMDWAQAIERLQRLAICYPTPQAQASALAEKGWFFGFLAAGKEQTG